MKKNEVGETHDLISRLTIRLQVSLVGIRLQGILLAKEETHRSMQQNREPRNGPTQIQSTDL